MDIEKLKALKTAVEIGSITQAAEHMGYSQPGLTGMLKRLEQEVGYPLLRRGTKGVRLTEAGEAVMPYIDRVLESSRALERALADEFPGMVVSGPRSPKHRLPGLLHVSFPGLEARRLVVLLERRGVSVGTGSACAASRMRESHVLHAMGLPPEVSAGSLRITMGRQTSIDDIDYAAAQIADAVRTEMRRTGLSQDDMLGRAGGLAVGRRR